MSKKDNKIIISSLVIFMISKLNTLNCGGNSCFSKDSNLTQCPLLQISFASTLAVFSYSCVFASDSFNLIFYFSFIFIIVYFFIPGLFHVFLK